jgi:small subunit ribosomal protein S1
VSEEYREAFGEHAYDEEGNYVGPVFAEAEFTPETEAQAAWADYVAEHGTTEGGPTEGGPAEGVAGAATVDADLGAQPQPAAAVAEPAPAEASSEVAASGGAPTAPSPVEAPAAAEAAPETAPEVAPG